MEANCKTYAHGWLAKEDGKLRLGIGEKPRASRYTGKAPALRGRENDVIDGHV
jgi:hypothetical protein